MNLPLSMPAESVEAIARRAAAIALEQLADRGDDQAGPWLSVEEAAERLRCKPQRIYDHRSSGALTPYTEGGRALCSREEVDALVVGGALSLAERRRTLRSA